MFEGIFNRSPGNGCHWQRWYFHRWSRQRKHRNTVLDWWRRPNAGRFDSWRREEIFHSDRILNVSLYSFHRIDVATDQGRFSHRVVGVIVSISPSSGPIRRRVHKVQVLSFWKEKKATSMKDWSLLRMKTAASSSDASKQHALRNDVSLPMESMENQSYWLMPWMLKFNPSRLDGEEFTASTNTLPKHCRWIIFYQLLQPWFYSHRKTHSSEHFLWVDGEFNGCGTEQIYSVDITPSDQVNRIHFLATLLIGKRTVKRD